MQVTNFIRVKNTFKLIYWSISSFAKLFFAHRLNAINDYSIRFINRLIENPVRNQKFKISFFYQLTAFYAKKIVSLGFAF